MKRTFSSRFVAVGNIDNRDAIVDRMKNSGRTYTDQNLIAAELAGAHVGPNRPRCPHWPDANLDCQVCGKALRQKNDGWILA